MKSYRVAYVCADPGVPVFGKKGCSIHVQEVVRALRRAGATVALFASRLGGDPPEDLRDVRTHALPCPRSGPQSEREQVCQQANAVLERQLEEAGPFDCVYERYSLWSDGGMGWAGAHGVPGLLEVNAPLIREQADHRQLIDRAGAERVAGNAFRNASAMIAVSDEVAEYLRGAAPRDAHIEVIPNGVDPARFEVEQEEECEADDPSSFVVGFIGTLKPWHGVPVLVEAFQALHAAWSDSRLLIVGDGPERGTLEARVQRERLQAAVRFTGAVDAGAVPGLLACMDVCVAPYPLLQNFYFSPLKVYEYMAAGKPVVASRLGQLCRIVEDGQTGLLCRPGDAEDLSRQLLRLRADAGLRRRLGTAARQAVVDGHTWDHVARRILGLAQQQAVREMSKGVGVA